MLCHDANSILGDRFKYKCFLLAAYSAPRGHYSPSALLTLLIAIYIYDRSLTLAREIALIQRRRGMSIATGLYCLIHISTTLLLFFVGIRVWFAESRMHAEVVIHMLLVRMV